MIVLELIQTTRTDQMSVRMERLGKALGMVPGSTGFDIVQRNLSGVRWWLIGGAFGDRPLPGTRGAETVDEALDCAEAWLAPEMEM